jgi:hypothetical protein
MRRRRSACRRGQRDSVDHRGPQPGHRPERRAHRATALQGRLCAHRRADSDPAKVPPLPAEGVIQITDPTTGNLRTFQRVADLFDDTVNVFLDHGRWVVWNLINLGGPTHPMHVHLAELQALSRKTVAAADGGVPEFDAAVGGTVAGNPLRVRDDRGLAENEKGWKDVFRVAAGDWLSVAGQFTGATGEFMFHCHILDHEDEGMMRPFVVMPPVSKFRVHRGGGGHQH